ncbi:putative adipose-regulatory protein-domain-containing protein [Lipomyces oligophaga]|uniref:putative adipose-regulatory protein-domain-containing protein n=1 Tax=Lipomyces oligophaga TaxID=45792 RepID=UPI0034CF9333
MASLFSPIWTVLFSPIRFLTSKLLLRTYLRVVLLFVVATSTFVFAVLTYLACYHTYIPFDSVSMPVYFDYSERNSPSSFVILPEDLSLFPNQDYKLSLHLVAPRSPHNSQLGNFMCSVRIYSTDPLDAISKSTDIPVSRLSSQVSRSSLELLSSSSELVSSVLHNITLLDAHRPGILTYKSELFETLYTLVTFPLLLAGFTQQSDPIVIPMASDWQYSSSSNYPRFVAAQIDRSIQLYSASLVWEVQWSGVRWLMRHYYVLTFCLGVISFWLCELTAALVSWVLFSAIFGISIPASEPSALGQSVKEEVNKPIAPSSTYLQSPSSFSTSPTASTSGDEPLASPISISGSSSSRSKESVVKDLESSGSDSPDLVAESSTTPATATGSSILTERTDDSNFSRKRTVQSADAPEKSK